MCASVALWDVIGEAEYALVVAVVPPQGAFDRDTLAFGLDHDRGGNERSFVAVNEFHERLDAALVFHFLAPLDRVTLVGKHNGDARIQECQLAQTMLECRKVELHHREGLWRWQERHFGAALALRVANGLERSLRDAVAELHEMLLAVAPDGELEPGRERIHHRDADAVQAARDLVGILVELTAGMELGHDDLGG